MVTLKGIFLTGETSRWMSELLCEVLSELPASEKVLKTLMITAGHAMSDVGRDGEECGMVGD